MDGNPDSHPLQLSDQLYEKLQSLEPTRKKRIFSKLITAALSSIPWLGGFLAAAREYKDEENQITSNQLEREWLREHSNRIQALARDLTAIIERLERVGDEIQDRIESEDYLVLVRRAFRSWDQADTEQKRAYIKLLISNAGASKLCPDGLVRLFLDWLDRYHEAHFIVIREIYKNPGITRHDIWKNIYDSFPREDSSEADLFRLLIGDLSLGRVIRQERQTNYQGQFLAKKRSKPTGSGVLKSAFDDEESYELTELGKQFVHYVFSDVVTRIENGPASN